MESYKAINLELIQRNNLLNTRLAQQRVEIVQLNRDLMDARKQSAMLKRTIQEVITVNSANYNRLVGVMLSGRDSAYEPPPDDGPRPTTVRAPLVAQQQQQQQKPVATHIRPYSNGSIRQAAQEQIVPKPPLDNPSSHIPKGPSHTPKEMLPARVVLTPIDQNITTATPKPKELSQARVVLKPIDPNVMAMALQPIPLKNGIMKPTTASTTAPRLGNTATNADTPLHPRTVTNAPALLRPCHVRSLSPFVSDDDEEQARTMGAESDESSVEHADDDDGDDEAEAADYCSENDTTGSQRDDHGLSVIAEEPTMAEQSCMDEKEDEDGDEEVQEDVSNVNDDAASNEASTEQSEIHSENVQESRTESITQNVPKECSSFLHSSESAVDNTNTSTSKSVPHCSQQPLLSTDASDHFSQQSSSNQVLYSPTILHKTSIVSNHQVATADDEPTDYETDDETEEYEHDNRSITLLPPPSEYSLTNRSSAHISGHVATRTRSAAVRRSSVDDNGGQNPRSPPLRTGYTLTHPNVSPADASMMSMLSSAISSTPRQTARHPLLGSARQSPGPGGRRSRYSGADESFQAGSRVMRSGRVHATTAYSGGELRPDSACGASTASATDSSLTRTGRPKRKAAPRNLKEEALNAKKRNTKTPPRVKARK